MTLAIGVAAPAFRLQTQSGEWVESADLRGRRVLLFFYQKDGSPGCTTEACEFRDLLPKFRARGVAVYGISPDSARKHANFAKRDRLTYPLLADPDHALCEAFGVWHEKLFWGNRYMGVVRTTFLIDPAGRIEQVWEKVHHEGHAADVVEWLRRSRIGRRAGRAK